MKYLLIIIFTVSLLASCSLIHKDISGIYINSEYEVINITLQGDEYSIDFIDWEHYKGKFKNKSTLFGDYLCRRGTYDITMSPSKKNGKECLLLNYQCQGCKKNDSQTVFEKIDKFQNIKEKNEYINKCKILRKSPKGVYLTSNKSYIYSIDQTFPESAVFKYFLINDKIAKVEKYSIKINDGKMFVLIDNKNSSIEEKKVNSSKYWFIGNDILYGEYHQYNYERYNVGDKFVQVKYKHKETNIITNKKSNPLDLIHFEGSEIIVTNDGSFLIANNEVICLPLTIDGGGYSESLIIDNYKERQEYFFDNKMKYENDIILYYYISDHYHNDSIQELNSRPEIRKEYSLKMKFEKM